MIEIELTPTELAVLVKYGTRPSLKKSGGFQGLIKALYIHTDTATGVMLLDDALLGKAVRYAISYGPGGFQDSFLRPLLRRTCQL
jgi:hypothetical protein